ncbi:DNA cytosine methyltransferase [Acidovorax sp.]|uniref:DNA cytosine methyltransferase n=1 Tax=Acidovorax sp. TaxID=1872122 RepID=UPI003918C36F
MTAYYNEIDPFAAQWLRNLINAGHIAPGIVDERSIEDVYPSDLRGFTQCHFFAGIGVWSHALRSAGWSDDRPVWTGSCPCQPFSAAGKGAGFDDERHLWPAFHHLIKECQPPIVIGEQVASADAMPWLDLVQTDLEALGYPFGAIPFPSAGVGAPHIRDRLYWVANANGGTGGQGGENVSRRIDGSDAQPRAGLGGGRVLDRLANPTSAGPQGREQPGERDDAQRTSVERDGAAGGMANDDSDRCEPRREGCEAMGHGQATGADRGPGGLADTTGGQHIASGAWADQRAMAGSHGALQTSPGPTSPTNGFWADADWLFCRDGKWRPVEPGSFPLAHGAPARVGRLRAYGNAINAKAAQVFIECVMDSL